MLSVLVGTYLPTATVLIRTWADCQSLAGCNISSSSSICPGGGDIEALLTQSLGASAPAKCLRQSGHLSYRPPSWRLLAPKGPKGTVYPKAHAPTRTRLAVQAPTKAMAGSGISYSDWQAPHALPSGGSATEPMLCRVLPDPPSHWVTRTPLSRAETSCKHPELANA